MIKNMTTTKDKKILLDLASDFGNFVKKHKWVPLYDVESDALSVTAPNLSKDARIKYFDDEIAFYMTKNNKVEGVFVEYFQSNFIKHRRNLTNVLKDIEKKEYQEKTLMKLTLNKFDEIASDLQEAIKLSLAEKFTLSLQT
jgi:hypothetical protein